MERCIICHRVFGKEHNNAKKKCSLNRFFSYQPGGALGIVLHELITECTGVDLDPLKQKQKSKQSKTSCRHTCLMCAHAMLHIKIKRNQLLVAKEKLTDLLSKEGFVCSEMVSSGPSAKRRDSGGLKRPHPDDPVALEIQHLAPAPVSSDVPKKKKKVGIRMGACRNIHNCKYGRAFKLAYKMSKRAKKQLGGAILELVRKEVSQFFKVKPAILDGNTDKTFQWNQILRAFKKNLPLLYSALEGALTGHNDNRLRLCSDGERIGRLVPGLGVILSSIIRMRSRSLIPKLGRITTLMGQFLQKYGTASKVMDALNHCGLCPTAATMRRFDRKVGLNYKYVNILAFSQEIMEESDEDELSEEGEQSEDKEQSDQEEQSEEGEQSEDKEQSDEEESDDEQSDQEEQSHKRNKVKKSKVNRRNKVKMSKVVRGTKSR